MRTCLIVDDSRVIRKIACRLLKDLGFEAEEAADGNEALARCRDRMPDFMIVDNVMPGMDGITFMKTLRREKKGALPPMIFSSTEHGESHIISARAAGATGILMKPYDFDMLSECLSALSITP
jgi:two-component system chemotaxis response regulator CheY